MLTLLNLKKYIHLKNKNPWNDTSCSYNEHMLNNKLIGIIREIRKNEYRIKFTDKIQVYKCIKDGYNTRIEYITENKNIYYAININDGYFNGEITRYIDISYNTSIPEDDYFKIKLPILK